MQGKISMRMRSVFFAITLLCASVVSAFSADSGYFIGDGGSGKRVLVYSSKLENGKSSDEWIVEKVKRDFISDFVNYSNIDVIDFGEKATVMKLQKDSETAYYSAENPIELGKAISAKSYIKLVCTKKESSYSLAATITNIETGRTEGSFTSPFYSEGDFVTKAHGEAAAKLLEALGVNLTAAGKRLLQYGSISNSVEDAAENLETYKAELARLEKEQAALMKNRSSEIDKEAEKARIEVQKATLLQQKKNEEERLSRLRDDEKRKQEETQLAKERSAESQKKIVALSKEIEEKAAKIRQQKVDNMTALQMIDVIEGEKQVLLANEKSIDSNIAAFNAEQDRLCEKETKERKSQKPRKTEINADGSLNDVGKQILESDLESIRNKYINLKQKNENQLRTSAKQSEENLKEKIYSDIKNLESKSFTTDSIQGSDVYFRVGIYDGSSNAQGWNYTLSFVFGGKTIFSTKGLLKYENITGKPVPSYPSANASNREAKVRAYNEYQDDVEAYDSFFRMNVPYIRAVLTYSVKSSGVDKPSEYIVYVKSISFINVQSNSQVAGEKSRDNVYAYAPSTLVDWIPQTVKDEIARKEAEENRIQADRKRIEEERHSAEEIKYRKRAAYRWADQSRGNGKHNGLGLGGGSLYLGDWSGFFIDVLLDLNITPWLFVNTELDFIHGSGFVDADKKPDGFEKSENEDGGVIGCKIGAGLNKRLHIFDFHPDLYYMFDAAYYSTCASGTVKKSGLPEEKVSIDEGTLAFLNTVGIGLPFYVDKSDDDLVASWEFDIRYTIALIPGIGMNHSISAGIRCCFPNFSFDD